MKYTATLILLFLLFFFTTCSKENTTPDNTTQEFSKFLGSYFGVGDYITNYGNSVIEIEKEDYNISAKINSITSSKVNVTFITTLPLPQKTFDIPFYKKNSINGEDEYIYQSGSMLTTELQFTVTYTNDPPLEANFVMSRYTAAKDLLEIFEIYLLKQ